VAVSAFAAARRAAARMLLTADRAVIDRSSGRWVHMQQQTRSSGVRRPDGTDGHDRRTDGRTPDSCIDPAAHTTRAVPTMRETVVRNTDRRRRQAVAGSSRQSQQVASLTRYLFIAAKIESL